MTYALRCADDAKRASRARCLTFSASLGTNCRCAYGGRTWATGDAATTPAATSSRLHTMICSWQDGTYMVYLCRKGGTLTVYHSLHIHLPLTPLADGVECVTVHGPAGMVFAQISACHSLGDMVY